MWNTFKKSFSKYRANKVEIDWIKFDSKLEWLYYEYLKDLWVKFEVHPKYELQEKFVGMSENIRAINYIADFSFFMWETEFVIDIKGMPTPEAKLKRKLFMYKYPKKALMWVVRYKWEWVDYFDNEKRKK